MKNSLFWNFFVMHRPLKSVQISFCWCIKLLSIIDLRLPNLWLFLILPNQQCSVYYFTNFGLFHLCFNFLFTYYIYSQGQYQMTSATKFIHVGAMRCSIFVCFLHQLKYFIWGVNFFKSESFNVEFPMWILSCFQINFIFFQ
jgi:hypothetical protein